MPLHLHEIIDIMTSKSGDDLFDTVSEILNRFNISTHDSNGNVKDLYTVICEIAEVWNKE